MSRFSKFAVIALVSFGALTAAHATPPVHQTVVYFGDLDKNTPEGARELFQRIKVAARKVCPNPDVRNGTRFYSTAACQSEAIVRAVHDVFEQQLAYTVVTQGR
jgi:UrcA family protein